MLQQFIQPTILQISRQIRQLKYQLLRHRASHQEDLPAILVVVRARIRHVNLLLIPASVRRLYHQVGHLAYQVNRRQAVHPLGRLVNHHVSRHACHLHNH